MTSWAALDAELERWETAEIKPCLWWRDDDAQAVSPALERLLLLSKTYDVPAHISVIPEGLQPDLAPRLRDTDHTYVLQHGLRHINHEPKGLPASEVGETRNLTLQRADLQQGWDILEVSGMPKLLTALVPPWNRIGGATRRLLPEWGYDFLSAYEGRGDAAAVTGLTHIDAHLDPIRWKYDRVFRGEDKMLGMFLEHLQDRRLNDPKKPIGYVTHHLQTSEAIWVFSDTLFSATRGMWASVPDMQKGIYNG